MATLSKFVGFLVVSTMVASAWGVIFPKVSPVEAAIPCRNVYSQDFSWRQLNRTGRVLIHNRRANPVQVTLIHPDSASQFANWTITAADRTFLVYDNQPFYVGDDWGVQIDGGCIFYLGEVGIYNSQVYEITLSEPRQISMSGLSSPDSPQGTPAVSREFYDNAAWCVWHEGVALFRAQSRQLVPPEYFRTRCSMKQGHNPAVLEMLGNASDRYIQTFLEQASRNLASERNFVGNLRWVAYNQKKINLLRGSARRGDANSIRYIYRSAQGHNPDARYLDATVSDPELIDICLGL